MTDRFIEEHRRELIEAVQTSLRFESVSDAEHAVEGAPFGKGCREALDHALGLCKDFGFETLDLEGYIGCADYGEGEETLGVLAHLDVVPAGEGWEHPPFGGVLVDGKIIGRGALDDKGPAMSAIFALAAVKSLNRPFKRKVRLLFGCDEECGMRCLAHYEKSGQPMPDMAFSPDADYPLVNGEKNIYHAAFRKDFDSKICVEAGTVVNAVPGKAMAFVPMPIGAVASFAAASEGETGLPFRCFHVEDGTEIEVTGVASHASMPENGQNALQALLYCLNKLPLEGEDKKAVAGLCEGFGMEYYGQSLGLDQKDDSGRLTLNFGILRWNEKGFTAEVDIRAPISLKEAEITEKLSMPFAKVGAELVQASMSEGYLVPEDSELVKSLLKVYRERTGDMTPPKRIGGGTYARHLKNAVAFGPERADRENLIHMANESTLAEDVIDNAKIIAAAIAELALA